MAQELRIVLVVHDDLVACGLASLLAETACLRVIACSRDLDTALLVDERLDVLLIGAPALPATEVGNRVTAIREALPGSKLCILSDSLEPQVVRAYVEAGIEGYVLTDTTVPLLLDALKRLVSGERYIDPRASAKLIRRGSPLDRDALSPREMEIVRLLARGDSNKQIAYELHLSEHTVKTRVSRIFDKLDVASRSQVAVHAIRSGLAN